MEPPLRAQLDHHAERHALLIHVGYPKTASTWLQSFLFAGEASNIQLAAPIDEVRDNLIRPFPLWYEPNTVARRFEERVDALRQQGSVPVVSNELLVGHPVSGGHDSTVLAHRLHSLWPDAKILIVVRKQDAMLLSLYKEYVRNGGYLTLSQYMFPPGSDRQPTFDFRYLEYDRLVQFYTQLFGSENVLVLAFEEFVRHRLSFCNELLSFAGADPIAHAPEEYARKSLGGWTIALRARFNRVFYGDTNNPVARFRVPSVGSRLNKIDRLWPRALHERCNRRMQREINEAVGTRFKGSNELLKSKTGCILSE